VTLKGAAKPHPSCPAPSRSSAPWGSHAHRPCPGPRRHSSSHLAFGASRQDLSGQIYFRMVQRARGQGPPNGRWGRMGKERRRRQERESYRPRPMFPSLSFLVSQVGMMIGSTSGLYVRIHASTVSGMLHRYFLPFLFFCHPQLPPR
jgi:hypothetical protein